MDDRDLIKGTAAWLVRTPVSEIMPELSITDALKEVPEFLNLLSAGKLSGLSFQPNDRAILILRLACGRLAEPNEKDLRSSLELIESLHDLIQEVAWPELDFGERAEILTDCAFAAWRISRRLGEPAKESRWLAKFRTALALPSPVRFEVERLLAVPVGQRLDRDLAVRLADSQLLLAVCELLWPRLDMSPTDVRTEAEFFCALLDKARRQIDLSDEHEYYLGEFALTAGTACRLLFRREEGRRWFDRAEASFTKAANGLAHVARVAYQRLALVIEERRLNEVLRSAPLLAERFESLGLVEDALKARFLEGLALRETGEIDRAVTVFLNICRQAEDQGYVRLVAQASNNLAQFYRVLGNLDEAMFYSKKALPLLKQLDNRVGLMKLRWGVGSILREQGKSAEAVAVYREALDEAQAIGMRGDVAALHLVLADVLLDAGQDRQAEWEVRAALPIIEEERMVPEGFAALSLLRNALLYQQVDRQALRDLHGYFGNSQA